MYELTKDKKNETGIPDSMKEKYETRSGLDLGDVRVHYNSPKPATMQALAYTQGNQVYVGSGNEKFLGHELGHVVQQKYGLVEPTTMINGQPANDSPHLEKQADRMSEWEI